MYICLNAITLLNPKPEPDRFQDGTGFHGFPTLHRNPEPYSFSLLFIRKKKVDDFITNSKLNTFETL